MNAEALRRELESQIDGEVRFDAVSRALYSTDASVYRIEPLGVVVPKSREDVVRAVRICGRHRGSITMRGGGTSQAGQAIGPGLPRLEAIERDLSARRLGYRYHRALDPAAQQTIWSLRETALGLSMAMKDEGKSISFVEDTAVAPEKLRDSFTNHYNPDVGMAGIDVLEAAGLGVALPPNRCCGRPLISQVEDFTGSRARHAAQLLRSLLPEPE